MLNALFQTCQPRPAELDSRIHVTISADSEHAAGVGALIRSITTNMKDTTRDVVFHVLFPTEAGKPAIETTLRCVDLRLSKRHYIDFVPFSPSITYVPFEELNWPNTSS